MHQLIQYVSFFNIFNDVKNIFNTQIKRQIYISLVQSILNYGITVWGQAYDSHTNSLKSTINSLTKFLLNKPRYTNNEYVYRELNIYNINALYFKNILVALYKYRHDAISTVSHEYCTRYKKVINIKIPKFHKHFGAKNSIPVAIQLCRILKINIFDFHNLRHFKLYLDHINLNEIYII
jgi:hypothetical protein